MDIQTQRDEFDVRFYRWALAEVQREVQAGFPLLRSIKNSYGLKTWEIMESLPREEQLKLALTLTRYNHHRALEITGERWTAEEKELRLSFERKKLTFNRYYLDFVQQLSSNRANVKVNRERLKTLVQAELKPIFGNVFQEGRFEWQYRVEIGGWSIDTNIKVDNSERVQLVYSHLIGVAGQEDVRLREQSIGMLECIGMPPTLWNLLTEADTPMAARSIALLCSQFMRVVPDLLAGLSPPSISPQLILINQAKQEAQLLKDEFDTRFYRWRLLDARREVEEGFPLVRSINNLDALETLAAMEPLAKEEQIRVALTLIRYTHRKKLKPDEYLTEEEEELWESIIKPRLVTYLIPTTSQIGEVYQQLYGGKPRIKVNKRKFRSLVKEELKPIIGSVFQKEGSDWDYRVRIGDWYVDTLVSNDPGLSYSHVIQTAERKHKALGSIVVSPGAGIDVLRWLGMGSTNWNLLTEEDIPMAAKSIALVCAHFMRVVPELLEGLSPV